MLQVLGEAEFRHVVRDKDRRDPKYFAVCWRVLGALTACWMSELGPQKLAVMLFLVNRTLYYRKAAQQIWQYQFINGVQDKETGHNICDGLGMTQNTIRRHLSELCDADFITVYSAQMTHGRGENQPRLYEINCKKILEPYQTEGSEMGIPIPKRLRKATEDAENDPVEGGYQNLGGGVPKFGTHNNINTRTKVLITAGASLSGDDDTGGNSPGSSASMLPTPRKPRTPRTGNTESSTAVATQIAERHAKAKADRVARAEVTAPWLLDKEDFQALLDRGMAQYHPTGLRVIVTGKEFGFLKKRLKESPPRNFADFIDWTLRYWSTIALQHRKAITRDETRQARKEKALGAAPNLPDLTYKLPYFLKAYSNFLAERTTMDVEEKVARREKALVSALEQEKQNTRLLRKKLTDRKQDAPAPAPSRQTVSVSVDDELPTWEQLQAKGK